MLKTNVIRLKISIFIIWLIIALAIFLPSFLDNASIKNALGTTAIVIFLILLPGAFIGNTIFQIKEKISGLILGSGVLISIIIPFHALLAKLNISWILPIAILIFVFYFIIKLKPFLSKSTLFINIELNIKKVIIIIFSFIVYALLIRQSLYVPSNNLDNFLVWPDTYNALAQAGEITHHGPSIFPFVADAQVPLKYHWGAFSLGSFISFFGSFELIVSIFKTQFILLGFLYFGILYISGNTIGKSWIAGIFSVILGGLTIYPTFPEFNEQIGISRPFISSTSMPQFTANVFSVLAIYLIYSHQERNKNLTFISLFFTTLSATLSKGPVGLLILVLAVTFILLDGKLNLKKNITTLFMPIFIGFLIAYLQIFSSSAINARNGTTLWFNPLDTIKLLLDGYGLTLDFKTYTVSITLFIISFSSLIFALVYSFYKKRLNTFLPFVITCISGIFGSLIFEAWGNSQLFLLYSVIPFLGVLLASSTFYKEKELKLDQLLLIFIGLMGQPIIFSLISSFIPRSQVLKTYILWIISCIVVFFFGILFAYFTKQSKITYLLIISLSIGMFSGLTKFDPKAYSLPDHPYSISFGTYEIANYLRLKSNKNDLLATNRHCAGFVEKQTCTARQFALSGLSERRVFIEGWSYTTCPLSEPILNKYWKEDSWKANQDFFRNPNDKSFEFLKKSGVDWLIVDSMRPSAKSYSQYAKLIKARGTVSLWKVNEPYPGIELKQAEPCGPNSIQVEN